jgi:hypothetical protein
MTTMSSYSVQASYTSRAVSSGIPHSHLFHEYVYIYVKGLPLFVDQLKLVEEEMVHIDFAIKLIGDNANIGECERTRLLRRREHLEFERQRHHHQRTSQQTRVESRRRNKSLKLQKQRELERLETAAKTGNQGKKQYVSKELERSRSRNCNTHLILQQEHEHERRMPRNRLAKAA